MVQSLTWASERDRSQRRRSVFLQVLEANQSEGRKLTRRKVDPGLTRQGSCVPVNRQDQEEKGIGSKQKVCTFDLARKIRGRARATYSSRKRIS